MSEVVWDSAESTAPIVEPTTSTPQTRTTFKSAAQALTETSRDDGTNTMRLSAGIVIGALVTLWFLGGVVFKNARIG